MAEGKQPGQSELWRRSLQCYIERAVPSNNSAGVKCGLRTRSMKIDHRFTLAGFPAYRGL